MNGELAREFKQALTEGILARWYPLVVDKEYGGYFTNVDANWSLPPEQEKMIVTQARHVWATTKVANFLGETEKYEGIARHGYRFLRDVMWDPQYGGFFQIRDRDGGQSQVNYWLDEKRAYGNAFAVYAIAALYAQTRDPEVLDFAIKAFDWVESHCYDKEDGGYHEFLTHEGEPFDRSSAYTSRAGDANELGFKDQNSSIHLLEAYTELYKVWDDPVLRERLEGLLKLIRDVIVSSRGYLQLFFRPGWDPVSFRDASPAERKANFGLDHVSFGHDVETAFLMLEASHALGLENDAKTLAVAKRMVDHALAYGWDMRVGGFYDGGYYFKGDDRCSIIKETKNWWAQAEGLNALLLFSRIFPDGKYYSAFLRQWEYVKEYIIDAERGDWFEGGIDKEPQFRTGPKSHMWKCTYHTCRSLMNCIALLQEGMDPGPGIAAKKREVEELISHWEEATALL